MSRRPGFDVMDVDTSIVNDTKFKRIARSRPEHVAPAVMAYLALLGESWKAAERVSLEDAWPLLLPFDEGVASSMKQAGLVDERGKIPATAWRKRFTEANQRRIRARDRYNRYNAKRGKSSTKDDVETTSLPRGSDIVTAASEPIRTEPIRTEPSSSKNHTRTARGVPNGHATDDPYDRAVAWLAERRAWVADGSKLQVELARMVDRKGVDAVIAAMAAVPDAEEAGQFVFGARNVLYPLPSTRTAAPAASDPTPDEVAAQLAERRRARQEGRARNA